MKVLGALVTALALDAYTGAMSMVLQRSPWRVHLVLAVFGCSKAIPCKFLIGYVITAGLRAEGFRPHDRLGSFRQRIDGARSLEPGEASGALGSRSAADAFPWGSRSSPSMPAQPSARPAGDLLYVLWGLSMHKVIALSVAQRPGCCGVCVCSRHQMKWTLWHVRARSEKREGPSFSGWVPIRVSGCTLFRV